MKMHSFVAHLKWLAILDIDPNSLFNIAREVILFRHVYEWLTKMYTFSPKSLRSKIKATNHVLPVAFFKRKYSARISF